MATITASQAATGVVPVNHGLSGTKKCVFGKVSLTGNVTAADIYRMCKIPAHSFVVGGELILSDMDTGTETLDIDAGWTTATGGAGDTFTDSADVVWDNAGATADPDGFVNSGVLTGDAITDLYATGSRRPFPLATGPLYFAKETFCDLTVVAAAATFAAGTMWVRLDVVLAG